jgi:nickel transport protein
VLILLLAATPAWAHKFRLFATVEGQAVHGQAYFSGGSHPQGVAVLLLDGKGETVGQGETDADGRFTVTLPATLSADGYRLLAKVDGHQAQWVLDGLPMAETQVLAPQGGGNGPDDLALATVERAVARQITPLRAQVDALQNTIRLHDILGGLGWLVGVAGLFSWWRSRPRVSSDHS